jgi:hypothetical protein
MLVELDLLAFHTEDLLDIRTKVAVPDEFRERRS